MLVSLDRTQNSMVVPYTNNLLEIRSRNLKQTLANNWMGYLDAAMVVVRQRDQP